MPIKSRIAPASPGMQPRPAPPSHAGYRPLPIAFDTRRIRSWGYSDEICSLFHKVQSKIQDVTIIVRGSSTNLRRLHSGNLRPAIANYTAPSRLLTSPSPYIQHSNHGSTKTSTLKKRMGSFAWFALQRMSSQSVDTPYPITYHHRRRRDNSMPQYRHHSTRSPTSFTRKSSRRRELLASSTKNHMILHTTKTWPSLSTD